jgi:hypothetical protein
MTDTKTALDAALDRVRLAKTNQYRAERNVEAAISAGDRAERVLADSKFEYEEAAKATRCALDALEDVAGEPSTEADDPGAIPHRGSLGVDLALANPGKAYKLNGEPVQRDEALQDYASAGAIEPAAADHDAEGEAVDDAEASAASAFGSIPGRIAEASGH